MEFIPAKLKDEFNSSNAHKKTEVTLYENNPVQPNQKVLIIPYFNLPDHNYPVTHAKALMEASIHDVMSSYQPIRSELPQALQQVCDFLIEAVAFLTSSEGWKTGWYLESEKEYLKELLENFFEDKKIEVNLDTTNRLSFIKEPLIIEDDKYFVVPEKYVYNRLYFVCVLPQSENPAMTAFACAVRNLQKTIVGHRKQQSFQQPDKIDYFKGQTDDYIHEEHLFLLQGFCRTLCYFINSYSWDKQELMNFDLLEIQSKLPIRI